MCIKVGHISRELMSIYLLFFFFDRADKACDRCSSNCVNYLQYACALVESVYMRSLLVAIRHYTSSVLHVVNVLTPI